MVSQTRHGDPSCVGKLHSRKIQAATYDSDVAAVPVLNTICNDFAVHLQLNSQILQASPTGTALRIKSSAEKEPVFDLGIAAEQDGLRLAYQNHPVMRRKSKCNRKSYPCRIVWKSMLFIASWMLGFAWAGQVSILTGTYCWNRVRSGRVER